MPVAGPRDSEPSLCIAELGDSAWSLIQIGVLRSITWLCFRWFQHAARTWNHYVVPGVWALCSDIDCGINSWVPLGIPYMSLNISLLVCKMGMSISTQTRLNQMKSTCLKAQHLTHVLPLGKSRSCLSACEVSFSSFWNELLLCWAPGFALLCISCHNCNRAEAQFLLLNKIFNQLWNLNTEICIWGLQTRISRSRFW